MSAVNQDHVLGGGFIAIVESSLPPVLAYFQGAAAPVSYETNLIIAVGAVIYYLVTQLRRPTAAPKPIEVPNA